MLHENHERHHRHRFSLEIHLNINARNKRNMETAKCHVSCAYRNATRNIRCEFMHSFVSFISSEFHQPAIDNANMQYERMATNEWKMKQKRKLLLLSLEIVLAINQLQRVATTMSKSKYGFGKKNGYEKHKERGDTEETIENHKTKWRTE